MVDSVYDGVPSVQVGVAVLPEINTCPQRVACSVLFNRYNNMPRPCGGIQ